MIKLYGGQYDSCHITIPKTYIIDKVHLRCNFQSFNLINEKNYFENVSLLYFDDVGKIDLFNIQKNDWLWEKEIILFFLLNALIKIGTEICK